MNRIHAVVDVKLHDLPQPKPAPQGWLDLEAAFHARINLDLWNGNYNVEAK